MITAAIGFIFSPLGRIVLIAFAIMAAVGVIDRRATYRERAKCETAALKAKLAAKEIDLQAASDAAAAANAARVESEAMAAESSKRISEYEDVLKTRPAGACGVISDDDLRRVRGKAGGHSP